MVLDREEKYKAKNFIDTVVYRGGDAFSAWIYTGLQGAGLAGSRIALAAVPLAGIWAWISFKLGQRQERMAKTAAKQPPTQKEETLMIDSHTKMTRRSFLGTVGTLTSAMLLAPRLLTAEESRILTRAIPSSGERLPVKG